MSIIATIFAVIGVFATVAGIVLVVASVHDKFECLERKIFNLDEKKMLDVEQIKERLKFLESYYCPDEDNQHFFEKFDKINSKINEIDHDLNGVNGLKFQTSILENRFSYLYSFTHNEIYNKCNDLAEDLSYSKNKYGCRLKWIFDNVLTQKQKDKYNEEFNND